MNAGNRRTENRRTMNRRTGNRIIGTMWQRKGNKKTENS